MGITLGQSHRPRSHAVFPVEEQTHERRETFEVDRKRDAYFDRFRTTRRFTTTNGRDCGLLLVRRRDTDGERSRVF